MKILGYQYTIDASRDSDDLAGFGEFRSKQQVLRMASDVCGQAQVSTLLHEIIEALNFHLELHLEHNSIMGLEVGLFQVLTDNGVDLSPLVKELEES